MLDGFFHFFIKSDGVFHWNGLSIRVFSYTMNNSVQLKDSELRLCFVFVNHTRIAFFSSTGMCCLCLFSYKTESLAKNRLKICRTVRNEKATVRPWERQWNRVTHGETMRVKRSGFKVLAQNIQQGKWIIT